MTARALAALLRASVRRSARRRRVLADVARALGCGWPASDAYVLDRARRAGALLRDHDDRELAALYALLGGVSRAGEPW